MLVVLFQDGDVGRQETHVEFSAMDTSTTLISSDSTARNGLKVTYLGFHNIGP